MFCDRVLNLDEHVRGTHSAICYSAGHYTYDDFVTKHLFEWLESVIILNLNLSNSGRHFADSVQDTLTFLHTWSCMLFSIKSSSVGKLL